MCMDACVNSVARCALLTSLCSNNLKIHSTQLNKYNRVLIIDANVR